MKNVGVLVVAIALLFFTDAAHATTWYVHPDSTLNSIQAGLESCADNDTVLVASGIYYESLSWPSKDRIDLISESGPDMTIIDGGEAGSVITMVTGVDSTTIINGFTIRNGSSVYGGGVWCSYSSPIIINSIITENTATGEGILCLPLSSPIIDSCTISNNNGDGVYCSNISSPVIHYDNITNNTSYGVCNSDDSVIVNAEYNWWGDPSGPSGVGPGTGDEVSDNVDYDPWLIDPLGIEAICFPQESMYWTGRVFYVNYVKSDGDWWADYVCAAEYRGWAKFDISGIPDDATITSIVLYAYDATTTPEDSTIDVYSIENDPVSAEGESLFNDCGNGNLYIDNWNCASAWNDITLGGNAAADLENNLSDDWFAVGIIPNTIYDAVWFSGYGAGENKPYIVVVYSTGIEEEKQVKRIREINFLEAVPNPFRGKIDISFQISNDSKVNLNIYNATGRLIRKFSTPAVCSTATVIWDGRDNFGNRLPSGIYFLKFTAGGDYSVTQKLLLIR